MSEAAFKQGWIARVVQSLRSMKAASADVLPVRTSYGTNPSGMASVMGVDKALMWVIVALLMWGLVMVYSASIALPDNPRFAKYSHTHFLMRHVFSLVVAVSVALLAFQIPIQTWEKVAPWLFVAALLLLIAVLIPGVGK